MVRNVITHRIGKARLSVRYTIELGEINIFAVCHKTRDITNRLNQRTFSAILESLYARENH